MTKQQADTLAFAILSKALIQQIDVSAFNQQVFVNFTDNVKAFSLEIQNELSDIDLELVQAFQDNLAKV
ncbi:hypothetical protein FW755_03230 [Lonepinella koalarum]|uniref:hypothetical protein n=1 Tax=Lonepinella koalarum TaxID=53417 RepID=UPI0011E4C000|nr:hypothetical protein [Lonepinella koalarum]TYG34171.1 hypothetical protein FW755_03230 [Lonepinella koalarum]